MASSSCSTTMTRVAEVAQPAQRLQQPLIVALVQADRRLVQHIEHAGQARADLRGKADALALAARKRAGVRATASGIPGPRRAGSAAARGSPSGSAPAISFCLALSCAEQSARTTPGPRAPRAATPAPICRPTIFTASASGFRRKPLHAAQGVSDMKRPSLLAGPVAVRLLPAPLQVAHDALEGLVHLVGAQAVVIGEADLLRRRSRTG